MTPQISRSARLVSIAFRTFNTQLNRRVAAPVRCLAAVVLAVSGTFAPVQSVAAAFPLTISGRVLNGTSPVAGVTVSVFCVSVAGSTCAFNTPPTTAADGTYVLGATAGRYDLYVNAGSTGSVMSTTTQFVDASAGTSLLGQDIHVQSTSTILSGDVTDTTTAAAIGGATVRMSIASQTRAGVTLIAASSISDSGGHYNMAVAPGTYFATAFKVASQQRRDIPTLVVSGAAAAQNFDLLTYPIAITGRVLNGAAPVSGAIVSATCVATTPGCTIWLLSITAADGAFTIFGSAPAKYDLYVRGPNQQGLNSTSSVLVDASAGGSFADQVVQASPSTLTISGRVSDHTTGAPLPGATVSLRIPQQSSVIGSTLSVVSALSDASGDYSLPAAPGNYSMTAAKTSYSTVTLASAAFSSSAPRDFSISPAPIISNLSSPQRIADTRTTLGAVGTGQSRCFAVAGIAGIPADAAAVVLNVTAVGYGALGWLTVYPNGQPVPATSTLNFDTSEYAMANGTIMRIGDSGQVCVSVGTINSAAGSSQIILDATGYLASTALTRLPMLASPQRVADTRTSGSPIGTGQSRCFLVAGVAGVPADAAAVVVNVTAVGYGTRGWLTVYPSGQAVPATSTLNFDTTQYAMANGTIMGIGSGGQVCVNVGTINSAPGSSHTILDVTGYVTTGALTSMAMLSSPQRLVDTRNAGAGPISSGSSRCFVIAGLMGIPATATGIIVNVTAVGYGTFGWLTAYPFGQVVPATSTLNFDPSEYAIANSTIVRLSSGQACVNVGTVNSAAGTSNAILDVVGYLIT